jgi:hypothetical protein
MNKKTDVKIEMALTHLQDAINTVKDNAYTVPSGLLLSLVTAEQHLKDIGEKDE